MTGTVNPKEGFYFDAPTKFTDGTDIPAGVITSYEIGVGQVSGTYPTIVADTDLTPKDGKQFSPINVIGVLAYGQWYAACRAVTKDAMKSAWSAPVPFMLAARTPEAPQNLSAV